MAHITLNYLSKTLGMHQMINVILPEDKSYFDTNENAKPLKTMLLLHGLSSDMFIKYFHFPKSVMTIL